jgi:TatD DNase family protein
MAATLTARGFLISFALPLAFRSAVGPRAAAPLLPAGSYLLETDAPYLGPERDGRNEPTTVLRVAAELGALRTLDPQAVATDAREAFERLIVQ